MPTHSLVKHPSFLRLKRTKIGLEDFKTVKVIGKGAFGEVATEFSSQVKGHWLIIRLCLGTTVSKSRHGQDLCDENAIQE